MRHEIYQVYVKIDAVEVSKLQTLYIDVYFLLNFTVDVISAFFALRLSKLDSTISRLILFSALLSLLSVLIIFIEDMVALKYIVSLIVLFISTYIIIYGVSFKRRIKYILSFMIFEGLVGGITTFLWDILDKYLKGSEEVEVENSRLLFFAIIVMLSVGVFKMIVSFFSHIEGCESVKIRINFIEKSVVCDAFVDTGNMATDPMDMRPVLILKPELAKKLLPSNVIELCDIDNIDREIRRRIRLIPISGAIGVRVLTGVRPDKVVVIRDEGEEEIFVTLAIDKEGGDFGGFLALMPAVAIYDAVR